MKLLITGLLFTLSFFSSAEPPISNSRIDFIHSREENNPIPKSVSQALKKGHDICVLNTNAYKKLSVIKADGSDHRVLSLDSIRELEDGENYQGYKLLQKAKHIGLCHATVITNSDSTFINELKEAKLIDKNNDTDLAAKKAHLDGKKVCIFGTTNSVYTVEFTGESNYIDSYDKMFTHIFDDTHRGFDEINKQGCDIKVVSSSPSKTIESIKGDLTISADDTCPTTHLVGHTRKEKTKCIRLHNNLSSYTTDKKLSCSELLGFFPGIKFREGVKCLKVELVDVYGIDSDYECAPEFNRKRNRCVRF